MIDLRKCHVCKRKFDASSDTGFKMDCKSCSEDNADVCRKCAKRIIVRDITESHVFQFQELPDPKFGGLILEAYSEVTQV